MSYPHLLLLQLIALLLTVTIVTGQDATCNHLSTSLCPSLLGFNSSDYSLDFTALSSIPPEWTLSSGATVPLGPNGAEFSFHQRLDSPQIWTSAYMFFGRVDVVLKAATGTGIISSVVLLSDDADEVDWEFSGNNFDSGGPTVQTNYFGKGIVGSYDRGTFPPLSAAPTADFHMYSLDWSPERLIWSMDGQVVRTLAAADCVTSDHQYPQSPSSVHLGLWDGGDPNNAPATIYWAGGVTDFSQAPFTMYVKSVRIQNSNPATSYSYNDTSGSAGSVQVVGGTPHTATGHCPDGDGSSFGSSNDYILECSMDRPWADIDNRGPVAFSDCISWCDSTETCVAVSWHSDDGHCWIKNAVPGQTSNAVVWGAVRSN